MRIIVLAAFILVTSSARAESVYQCGPFRAELSFLGSSSVSDGNGRGWEWDSEDASPLYCKRGTLRLGKSPTWNLGREYICECVSGPCLQGKPCQ